MIAQVRGIAWGVLAGGATAALVGVAAATGEQRPPGHNNPAAIRLELQASGLINRASGKVRAHDQSCRVTFKPTPPVIVDGGPGPEISALLGVFRRPPSAEDQTAAAVLFATHRPSPISAEIPRDGVRVVHAADGTRVTLVAATKVRPFDLGQSPAVRTHCDQATLAELIRLARQTPSAAANRAVRDLRQLQKRERPPAVAATEGLETMTDGSGGGGPFNPKQFVNHPPGFSSGGGHGSRVILVLPDGVATADLTFSRYASRGPYRNPVDYRRARHVSVRVVDNVISLSVTGRGPGDAFPSTVVERANDGNVIRTIHASL